jgi:hypothetical protein
MNTRVAVLFLSTLAVACTRAAAPPSDAASAGAPAPAAQGTPVAAAGAQLGEPALATVNGTIVETMDAGGYTYMKLRTATGEEWTAVNQAAVKTGDSVTVVEGLPMEGFESRSLGRKFDRIYFGRLAGPETAPAGGGAAGSFPPEMLAALAAQHSGAATAAAPKGDVKVPKAEGPEGSTIAEVYAGKAGLEGKTVAVRGTVVKFNPAIMGRNWVHIRDGSGSPETRDNDLTLTTQDTVAVGAVVLARGTVRLDKDFGAGYTYPVILEDVKITK